MGTLGLFLFALLVLGGGLGMAALAGILSYKRFRHVGYTVSWTLGVIVGTCALIFSLIAVPFGALVATRTEDHSTPSRHRWVGDFTC